MHHHVLRKKRFFIYVQIAIFFVGAIYLLFRHDQLSVPSSWGLPHHSAHPTTTDPAGGSSKIPPMPSSTPTTSSPDEEEENKQKQDGKGASKAGGTSPTATPKPKKTKEDLRAIAQTYIPSILDPLDTSKDRMTCPPTNTTRYAHLQAAPSKSSDKPTKPAYFIALNLRQCVDLLPRLLGSLLETIRFLGPDRCAVSIVEGNSGDGTLEVLELLAPPFKSLGVPYFLRTTPLDPSASLRIEKLAMLRAMAVSPITGMGVPDVAPDDPLFPTVVPPVVEKLELADDATVLFLNDVAACPDDLLELLHQRVVQNADMTCAMDWTHPGGGGPTFYDVWVARALDGDLFFDIPTEPAVSWDRAGELFWNEPVARARYESKRKPFQVFACWNGAVAFTATPLVEREVWFRAAGEGECFQGEPQLFCKDMWHKGYGKIAVVPSVNLEYTDQAGRRTKEEKGFVGDWVRDEQHGDDKNGTGLMVPWREEPPKMVKCMPMFEMQSWLPWNESLPPVG